AYDFGYEVGPNGQFHHENKGPDGVVYGCYGYVDPDGKLRATHYVSDGWGYRVVKPGQPVELFLHHHETNQLDSNNPGEDKEVVAVFIVQKEMEKPMVLGVLSGRNQRKTEVQVEDKKNQLGQEAKLEGHQEIQHNQVVLKGQEVRHTQVVKDLLKDNQENQDIQVDQVDREGLEVQEVQHTQVVKNLLKDNQEDQDIQVGQEDPEVQHT
ncbi:unnamed protein product, partial [Timema podura]|nr:unnamed protein product [Timema podura]